jgi:hypothetical protein
MYVHQRECVYFGGIFLFMLNLPKIKEVKQKLPKRCQNFRLNKRIRTQSISRRDMKNMQKEDQQNWRLKPELFIKQNTGGR